MLGKGVGGGPPVAAAYLAFRLYCWAGVKLGSPGSPPPGQGAPLRLVSGDRGSPTLFSALRWWHPPPPVPPIWETSLERRLDKCGDTMEDRRLTV